MKGRPVEHFPAMPVADEEAWHRAVMRNDYPAEQLEKADLTELKKLFREKSKRFNIVHFGDKEDAITSSFSIDFHSSGSGVVTADSFPVKYFDVNTIKIRKQRTKK